MWIELPWPENLANTYAWYTETLDSCFNFIRSYQQCILWSPPLEIEPATTVFPYVMYKYSPDFLVKTNYFTMIFLSLKYLPVLARSSGTLFKIESLFSYFMQWLSDNGQNDLHVISYLTLFLGLVPKLRIWIQSESLQSALLWQLLFGSFTWETRLISIIAAAAALMKILESLPTLAKPPLTLLAYKINFLMKLICSPPLHTHTHFHTLYLSFFHFQNAECIKRNQGVFLTIQ